MYYCNINGFKSKQESLGEIVDKLQPKIVILCETKLASGNLLKKLLPGYDISNKPTKAGKSGLAIAVKYQTFKSVLDVTNSSHQNILTTRIEMASMAIRIILGYAPQETENSEAREGFFTELEVEVTRSKLNGDIPLVIGDLNAKIEETPTKIASITSNGKLLLELINNQDLDVMNFNNKCKGKWTHVIRTTGASSVLDYMLTDKTLTPVVKEMIIDEDCLFCPFLIRKEKEPQFSDHNALITNMEIEHIKKEPPKTSSSCK